MAHLSEDPNMTEAFREGNDIHAATAAKIWHEDISQVTDAQRKKQRLPTSESSMVLPLSDWHNA